MLLGQLVSFNCLLELLFPVLLIALFKNLDLFLPLRELSLDITNVFITSLEYFSEKFVMLAYGDLRSRLRKALFEDSQRSF